MAAPYEVLVIDDEPGDIELVRRAIESGPYPCRVTTAIDGTDGLSKIRSAAHGAPPAATPDLILLDLNMPRMNGREFLQAIKHDPHLAHIPVVVLTTSTAERDVDRVYDLGAAGYVTKPVDLDQLYKTIHSIEDYWFSVVRIPHRPI